MYNFEQCDFIVAFLCNSSRCKDSIFEALEKYFPRFSQSGLSNSRKKYLNNIIFVRKKTLLSIGHGNRDHVTSYIMHQRAPTEGAWSALFSNLSKSGLDNRQISSKALQAPSVGGGFVIPITVPYTVTIMCLYCLVSELIWAFSHEY